MVLEPCAPFTWRPAEVRALKNVGLSVCWALIGTVNFIADPVGIATLRWNLDWIMANLNSNLIDTQWQLPWHCLFVSTLCVHVPVHWKAPNPSWISLNVDGAVSIHTGFGFIGGVFRDHEGAWVLVHTDSLEAVKLLEHPNAATSSLLLIRAMDKARQQAWVTVIHWTPRPGNVPADSIAKLVNPLSHETIITEEPLS
ncbi:hypothetical protein F3Y22_tig00110788pilonHSYRG00238 [Hibiscus syriacus]|uniref:RNase H type-1 domain-containing protein n=1 Tax=Hibiscus syriacus TaxID=106335 RepID=A0A6A2ZQG4_HIBSY|nr:hypothetical protein F3Y22_tig00110788pilonHSYRG00238 [Hibiscus syriacus]